MSQSQPAYENEYLAALPDDVKHTITDALTLMAALTCIRIEIWPMGTHFKYPTTPTINQDWSLRNIE